jgi:hypothetical protein
MDVEKDTMTIVGGFSRSAPGSKIRAGFGVWHVPQLQLEMFCVGAHCRSAVMAILCVTGLRLYRVERDDEVRFCSCRCAAVRCRFASISGDGFGLYSYRTYTFSHDIMMTFTWLLICSLSNAACVPCCSTSRA